MSKNQRKFFSIPNPYPYLIALSLVIWYISLNKFFAGEISIFADASAFFEHAKYFLDQIFKGIYPLWDPTRDAGIPNEIFLRRIGSYNPFYLLVKLGQLLGIPFRFSYFSFLAFYFSLGLVGFYLLLKEVFSDKCLAYCGFGLLLFSQLASLLFNSFILLVFTPMSWFFYLLFIFFKRPSKLSLLGLIFTLMLLGTTYIPFYFITIVIIFMMIFLPLYFKEIKGVVPQGLRFLFFKNNRLFSIFCLTLLALSTIPSYMFYLDAQKGNFVLPYRYTSEVHEGSAITVPAQTTARGGIVALNFNNDMFVNLDKVQLGHFYIPIFAHILFLLGLFLKANRRIILLCLFGMIFYLIGTYGAGPLYKFLYKYVFYFKFFRNFQFFLWLVILPSYLIICVEHFRLFLDWCEKEKNSAKLFLTASIVHAVFLIFLIFFQSNVILSSYVSTVSSFVFFSLIITKRLKRGSFLFLCFLTALICMQPFRVNGYLQNNTDPSKPKWRYEVPYEEFGYKKAIDFVTGFYFSTKWYQQLTQHPQVEHLNKALSHYFYIYDQELPVDQIMIGGQAVEGPSKEFRVVDYNMVSITLATNFPRKGYLLYRDNYYEGWQAEIDGKKTELKRVNIAFKGIWVPAGEHTVKFQFGSKRLHLFHWFYLVLFTGVLILIVVMSCRVSSSRVKSST